MERDLMVMIYGAIMGVVGSIVTSIITALFQLWLERREFERRQSQQRQRQLHQIHLPTDEEVRMINAQRQVESSPESARTLAEAGSVILSILLSSLVVYQVREPLLGFVFGALLGFLATHRLIQALTR